MEVPLMGSKGLCQGSLLSGKPLESETKQYVIVEEPQWPVMKRTGLREGMRTLEFKQGPPPAAEPGWSARLVAQSPSYAELK